MHKTIPRVVLAVCLVGGASPACHLFESLDSYWGGTPEAGTGAGGEGGIGGSGGESGAAGQDSDAATKCTEQFCSSHGSCDDSSGVAKCSCTSGYTGTHCDTCVQGYVEWPKDSKTCVDDPCLPDPCSGAHVVSGSCTLVEAATYRCGCEQYYEWSSGACLQGCVDADGDGYGTGATCKGPDCSEDDGKVWKDGQLTVTDVQFDKAGSSLTVTPKQVVSGSFKWLMTQACSFCLQEIVVGLAGTAYPSDAQACKPPASPLDWCPAFGVGSFNFKLTAPDNPGVFGVHASLVPGHDCDEALAALAPDENNKIGQITVAAPPCGPGQGYVTDVTLNGSPLQVSVGGGAVVQFLSKYLITGPAPGGAQLVVGMDDKAVGCLYDGKPGDCPGESGTSQVTILAPSVLGSHVVRVARAEFGGCTAAMADYNATPPGSKATVGIVVVK